jgi:hypothetical protein
LISVLYQWQFRDGRAENGFVGVAVNLMALSGAVSGQGHPVLLADASIAQPACESVPQAVESALVSDAALTLALPFFDYPGRLAPINICGGHDRDECR